MCVWAVCTKKHQSVHGTLVVLTIIICISIYIDTKNPTNAVHTSLENKKIFLSNWTKMKIFTIFRLWNDDLFLFHTKPKIVGITAIHCLLQVTTPCMDVLSRSSPKPIFLHDTYKFDPCWHLYYGTDFLHLECKM